MNSVTRSSWSQKQKQLDAANELSRIKGQPFPQVGYRVIEIDTRKIKSWETFGRHLNGNFPESYSATLSGAEKFFKEAAGGHVPVKASAFLVLAVKVAPAEWMFNLPFLYKFLPQVERTKPDSAGFSLREYLGQAEVVAKPGTMKAAIYSGRVSLVAYAREGSLAKLSKPKPIAL